jgi:hypothetical protein
MVGVGRVEAGAGTRDNLLLEQVVDDSRQADEAAGLILVAPVCGGSATRERGQTWADSNLCAQWMPSSGTLSV